MSYDKIGPDEKLTDHNYDGIKELDNQLPDWWLFILIFSVGWGALYWLHFSIAGGETQIEEYDRKMAIVASLQKKSEEKSMAASGKDLLKPEDLIGDKVMIAAGQKNYITNCASCHGKAGEGSIGPNLTDNYWIHGEGKIGDVIHVLNVGVLEKGMPPWKGVLSTQKITELAVFVDSLRETNPDNAKAPQGKEYKSE